MVTEQPEAYYKVDEEIFPCSLVQAHLWLLGGFLTSDTPFSIRKADGQDGEWTTVGALMSRNGREMPFIEWFSSEEQRMEQEQQLDELTSELDQLGRRRQQMMQSLRAMQERKIKNKKELDRLLAKYPPDEEQSAQTHAKLIKSDSKSVSVDSVTTPRPSSPVYPQITPDQGVDPFALLRSCIGARRKVQDDVVGKFRKLKLLFDRCDKKRLRQQTDALINKSKPKMCSLCRTKVESTSNFIEHICSSKHVMAMASVVCMEAFVFWYKAVDEAASAEPAFREPANGYSEPSYSQGINPKSVHITLTNSRAAQPDPGYVSSSSGEAVTRSVNGVNPVAPRIDIPELQILRKMKTVDNPCADPKDALARMLRLFRVCDKKKLDNDRETMGFFTKPLLCIICNGKAIDKASNLVTHITGNTHVEKLVSENYKVPRDAIDFWIRAVQRASITFTINN